ncbi:MAG: cupin domain-containing protein [Phycisphaeraceae bacterium]
MIRTAEQSEKFAVAGDVYAFLATGEETDGSYTLIEARVPAGGGPPPHTQSDVELFYVLTGEVTFTVDGEDVVAGSGTSVRVVPRVVHAFKNHSTSDVRMLIQALPAGMDQYFRKVGVVVDSMNDDVPITPEHIAKLKALAPQYGIEILA